MKTDYTSDVLIIGSGLAGLLLAIELASNSTYKIFVISKREIDNTNTRHAQGGIASVLSDSDTFEKHVKDTLVAGDGLCKKDIVEKIIQEGPKIIEKLKSLGVEFNIDSTKNFELGREGGHSERRVAHVEDHTGRDIQMAIVKAAQSFENINIFEHYTAIDLVNINGQVAGAYILENQTQQVLSFSARITVLATGGAGKVFLYTSNPDVASGDGVAMAYRVGATLANLEFIQFHPTLYYNPHFHSFLITEAIRGEGAILKNLDGKRFMEGVHPLAELAPRDVVSRAIYEEMRRSGDDHVLLDISFKDKDFIKSRFPTIYSTLLKFGLDITQEPIPVVPAAHYTIGGVRTDLDGQTNIKALFAIGEVANTGLHGANRLASNSLLEAAYMAIHASRKILELLSSEEYRNYTFPPWETGDAVNSDEAIIISHNWDELRRAMWSYVGIVRTTKRLLRAKKRIELLKHEINEYYWNFKVTSDIIELRNLVQVAELIVDAALFRKESRGTHYTLDYPFKMNDSRETLIQKQLGIFQSETIYTHDQL